jgi:hypothetical protein
MNVSIGKAYADTLLERLGISGSPDLQNIAIRVGLTIEEARVSGFEGALVRPVGGSVGIIVLSDSIRERGRRNFTIAHEIGHFLLPGHDTEECVCFSRDLESWKEELDRRELDANEFAAELLIPTFLVQTRVTAMEPSLRPIAEIAKEFSASLTAATRRFVELTTHRCAMVWSTRGRIIWYAKSSEFGHHVRVGECIDRHALAYGCFTGSGRQVGPAPVPADSWLPDHNLVPNAQILEESISLPFYESVLSLLWIQERIEKRTEWHEQEEEPLDPEEFTLSRKRWPRK